MSNEVLVIAEIDTALLEQQRLALATINPLLLDATQRDALEGILLMLESWGDEIYFKKCKNER